MTESSRPNPYAAPKAPEPFFIQAGIGILAWLGLYLRDYRLRALLPLRSV